MTAEWGRDPWWEPVSARRRPVRGRARPPSPWNSRGASARSTKMPPSAMIPSRVGDGWTLPLSGRRLVALGGGCVGWQPKPRLWALLADQ
jgi:hypothetical protein